MTDTADGSVARIVRLEGRRRCSKGRTDGGVGGQVTKSQGVVPKTLNNIVAGPRNLCWFYRSNRIPTENGAAKHQAKTDVQNCENTRTGEVHFFIHIYLV